MMDLNATILCCTPSYAAFIGESLAEKGYKPEDNKLKAGIFGAEPWTEEMRRSIEKSLGIKAYDIYGLTETSPLLGYAMHHWRAVGSFGYPVYNVQLKLHNVDPKTGEGEIVAKGPNVMLGYYKDPVRTKSVFTEDGWFRTSDIATIDEKGRYFIKGRNSNMILGPSGENIYPEEIENVINNVEGVSESIVVERDGRLVALVQPMENYIEWDNENVDKIYDFIESWKKKLLKDVNKNVNKSSQVSSVEVMKEPFEKTATQKIRRFKYKETAPTVEQEKKSEKDKKEKN
jgi:long-chain acyl-CoA synthetase